MHIRVDEKGITCPEPGTPNARVCLHSDPKAFLRFYIPRVAAPSSTPNSRPTKSIPLQKLLDIIQNIELYALHETFQIL
jgi:hypothetical protein